MLRLHLQALAVPLTAGLAMGMWVLLDAATAWPMSGLWMSAGLGAGAAALGVGVAHYGWTRAERRRWQTLHKRQNRLNRHQRELECKVKLLELERQRLETIFNVLNDAVLVTDADETVQLANEAAARLLDFQLAEVRQQPVDRVVRDTRLLELIREAHVPVGGRGEQHVEHRMGSDSDGESTVFDLTLVSVDPDLASPREDEPGTREASAATTSADAPPPHTGVVAVLRDVTRQRCVAEMHSDFVSNVSHELRTPLSSIKAYMEMLVDGEASDEPTRQEFYAIIQAETNRLTRLIDNVLNINQIEAGLVRVQSEVVDLYAMVKQAMDLVRPQARAAKVNLIAPETELACQVIADRDMLLQAMLNLLSNALKYTPEEGAVTVQLRELPRSGAVEVSVSDTGVGIPSEDMPFVFDKFYRVPDHQPLVRGTGLGLNLVKHVVETVHGGKLSVSSTPDCGSTFTFRLPMAEKGNGGYDKELENASPAVGESDTPCAMME